MRASRIVAIVIGCLILLPGIGLLLGGGVLGIGYLAGRNDAGYFETALTDLHSPTAAITAGTPTMTTDLQTPSWLTDSLDIDTQLMVTGPRNDSLTFVGIGPTADVDAYLNGVGRDTIIGFSNGSPTYRSSADPVIAAAPPAEQSFWTVAASGPGTQQLSWRPTDGRWTVVIMNADGAAGVTTAATVQVHAGFLVPLVLTLLLVGIFITAGGVALIVVGARPTDSVGVGSFAGPDAAGETGRGGRATSEHPVALVAELDPALSRWMWLVKWFLAIPHYLVLAFLWIAFLVITVIAGFAILFTGRYPRPLFEFTSGVLRWSWRVSYYAASGGLGTDRYPPFTLGHAPGYPASLEIVYPTTLSRGLVLVKWWLLAIPHYLIIGFFVSNWWDWTPGGDRFAVGPVGSGGLFGLLVLVTAIVLLVTGKYPSQLFALIVGGNRWIYRVVAYSTLMTDQYPPFRLDQGGAEPGTPEPAPAGGPANSKAPEAVNGPVVS